MATIEVNPSIYFECPVCMEDIDDSWKMLPCQHVFCHGCLRQLYEADQNQNPLCPTCRQAIAVPLERLQKPRLLYEMHENLKASARNRGTTDDIDGDLIAAIEQQSIDDLRKEREEIDRENEHLQIALCKSADEAAQKAEIESLLCVEEADLIAAIELSIQENAKRSSSLAAANLPDRGTLDGRTLTQNSSAADTIKGPPVSFCLSDFNDYLRTNGNAVLNTILTVISNEEELNSMESTEIISYLKTVDRYLSTLNNFRKRQIAMMIEDFGEADERLTRAITSQNGSNGDGEKSTGSRDNEEDKLIGLVRALELEKNDDALLRITLKKSEVLDPIDALRKQFLGIKKTLENTLLEVVIKSESRHQAAAATYSSSPQPRPVSTTSRSLILPLPSASTRLTSTPHRSGSPILPFSPSIPTTNRPLILPLPSGSIHPSSSFADCRGRGNNYINYHRGPNNYYWGHRGNRGGTPNNVRFVGNPGNFNGNRGNSHENCGSFKSRGGYGRTFRRRR